MVRLNNKHVPIHHLVLPDVKERDHINQVKTDNRRSNLRSVTHSQNCMNKRVQPNNECGTTGVGMDKRSGRWYARIKKEGKQIYLGCFADKSEAVAIRKEAEARLFGEFASPSSEQPSEG